MSNLYDTFRWKTPVNLWLLAFVMLSAANNLKNPTQTCDAPLYMSVKLDLISTAMGPKGEPLTRGATEEDGPTAAPHRGETRSEAHQSGNDSQCAENK
jgi:hypothetical protein